MNKKHLTIAVFLVSSIVLPVMGEVDVKTTVTEFRIAQLLEKDSFDNDGMGTTVLLELVNTFEDGILTGAEIDTSKITFNDSTGKDLFAAGKKARTAYNKTSNTRGGLRRVENSLSVNPASVIGPDTVQPGSVHLRCYALTIPEKNATGVEIKGEIKVYTESDQTKTDVITKKQLTSERPFKLGDISFQFKYMGGGGVNNRSYSTYEFISFARIKQFEVTGKTKKPSPFDIEEYKVKIYTDELEDTDEIKITYSLPPCLWNQPPPSTCR